MAQAEGVREWGSSVGNLCAEARYLVAIRRRQGAEALSPGSRITSYVAAPDIIGCRTAALAAQAECSR